MQNPESNQLDQMAKTLKETSFPKQIEVEAVYGCNLSCIMCPLSTMKREPHGIGPTGVRAIMDLGLYKKICQEIGEKGQEVETQLWLPLMGELFLIGEKSLEYIKIAKDMKVPKVIVNSNGTVMTEKIADGILALGLDDIYFGVDAKKQETYQKIRRNGNLETVEKNISYLLKRKKELGLKKPNIYLQFIVMPENYQEEEAFKNFWLEKGAFVKTRRKLGWGPTFKAENLNLPQSARQFPCPWLIRQMQIQQDGRVSQCDTDYECAYPAGDITRQTIEEVWQGELKKRRDQQWANDFSHPLCQDCLDWQVGLSKFYQPNQ